MERMIAFCGLTCTECDAYKATQANDDALRAAVAAKWSVEFNAPGIKAADINCDGCLKNERLFGHCLECDIRACAMSRGVANCAHCSEYLTCPKIAGFVQMVPPAKTTLDAIHATL